MDDIAKAGGIFHKVIMLGAVPRDADRIGFLKRIAADQARRHLSGDDDHWDRIHQGVSDAGDRVGRTGSASDQHNAGFAR